MSNFIPMLIWVGSFFLLLTLALFVILKTLKALFALNIGNPFRVSVIFNAIMIAIYLGVNNNFPDFYRILLYYLGILNYGFFVALIFWLPMWLVKLTKNHWPKLSKSFKRLAGIAYISATTFVVGLAIYNFHKPDTLVTFELSSDKLSKAVRFVHISDIQYGTTTREEMNAKLERVYALEPDFIVFTGDLVDFDGYATEDFAVLANSPVPIFFERGNHEFYHDPKRLLNDLKNLGTLDLLINRKVSFGEVDIVGVDYSDQEGHLATQLNDIPLDENRFSMLLYHEPIDVEHGVAHGFDLLLFGHTHGGQMWPFTWVVDAIYTYADGFFKLGDSVVYTSDGLSLWGPRMRLGSQNEFVLFTINPI